MSAIDARASKGLTGECIRCGSPPPEELQEVVLFPGAWACHECYNEDPDWAHEKAAQQCSCAASKTIDWLGGCLIMRKAKHKIPISEVWFMLEEVQEDGTIKEVIKKTRNHRGLLVEKPITS